VRLKESQQRRRRDHCDDTLGLSLPTERHATGVVERLFLEDRRLFQAIVVIRHAGRAGHDARARVGVVHMNELGRLRHGQWPQQHRVDDGKNGGVSADADAKRQQGRDREAAILPEYPRGKLQVLKKSFHDRLLRIDEVLRSAYFF
jgi:hypothetical protein